jgi:hypothetical protein
MPMVDHYVTLDELGFPHIYVFESGKIFDEETNHWFKPNTEYVTITNHQTKQSRTVSRNRLYGYCFRAPWRNRLCYPYRCLDFLGYPNYYATWDGKIFGTHKMDYLREDISDDGYPECVVVDSLKKLHYYKTHRLIAQAFVPNPENKDTVNHIDGNKQNNRADNLEWLWNWENMDHALKVGLKHSVMSDQMVHEACKLISQGYSPSYISQLLSIEEHNIRDILDGCHYRISRLYSHIPYYSALRHVPNEFKQEAYERITGKPLVRNLP